MRIAELSGTRGLSAQGGRGADEEKWPLKLGHFRKEECTVTGPDKRSPPPDSTSGRDSG